MFSRLARYQVNSSVLALALVSVVACGGAGDPVKTPDAEAKKKAVDNAKHAPTNVQPPARADVKNDKPAEKRTTDSNPATPKERFALPNISLDPPEARRKITFGGQRLTAEACWLDTSVPELEDEWFPNPLRHLVASPDGSIYLTDQHNKVRHYIPEPGEVCKLAIDPSFGEKGLLTLPEDPKSLTVLPDGTLAVMGLNKFYKYIGGKAETIDCKVHDLFPDGKTGFSYRDDHVWRVDVPASCQETEWKFTGWDPPKAVPGQDSGKWLVSRVRPWNGDYLLFTSMHSDHYLGIHSPDGTLKIKIGKYREKLKNANETEDICHPADAGKCAAGICVLDYNCRKLTAWDPKNGKLIDSVLLGDLIGVYYPWPVAFASTKGFTYIGVTVEAKKDRDKTPKSDAKKISYGAVFRVKGLD